MDASNFIRYVIIKNGEYLVSVPYSDTLVIRWSQSRYDAAQFYRRRIAVRVANRVGGRVETFNTLTGVIG